MADVLIVCVREDEPQAKSLADMFERAGFSVGGAPSNDGALRGSGAAVVVWSQASIRSRPFLDAAQRAVNAKKAIIASMIDPPPPASVNEAPAYDLRGWAGDPDDPVLDPLYFAVDRQVNAQRAAVGAPAAQPAPAPFEPPPSLRPPPSTPPYARSARTAPPQTRQPPQAPLPPGFQMRGAAQPAPQPTPAPHPMRAPAFEQNDPLGSEAEHWRAIRHSNDPTEFLDYLAKYGPDGAFSELADIRLRQLEGENPPPQQQARSAPEPQRYAPPQPPPTPQRRPEPRRREPAFEAVPETPRYYDNTARPERAPKSGGGLLRAFILLLLLGGAALGAGYYFGRPTESQPAAAARSDEATTTPSSDASEAQPAGTQTAESTADTSSSSSAQADTPQRYAAVTTPQRPTTPQRGTPASTSSEDTTTPPPQTSWSTSSGYAGGPVSLVPAEQQPETGNVVIPQTTTVSTTTTAPAAAALPHGTVAWAQRPNGRRVGAVYPQRAAREGVGGRVDLDCTVGSDLGVSCSIASETPVGRGFGAAALQLAPSFRAEHFLSNGQPAEGAHVRIPMVFQPPQN
ncbi:MAG: hypothetical protein ABUS48_06295 [Pseudomonadota bacterium]